MKKLALAALLLLPATIFAASTKPNRADFPLTVHVVSSAWHVGYANTASYQTLETVTDNQSVELQAGTTGVLALGDYPARISPKVHAPKNPNAYDMYRGYDLLMPDGTTRTYTVTGLGPPSTNP